LIAVLLLTSSLQGESSNATPLVNSLTTFATQIIPLVTVGDGWSQRFVVQNTDTLFPSAVSLKFFTQTGSAMSVQLKGVANPGSSFTFNLQVGKTIEFETVVSPLPLQIGWAYLESGVAGSGDFFGQTIFRKQTAGLPDFMCSMVFGGLGFRQLSTFFDNTNGNVTGMGIVTSINCTTLSCAATVPLIATVRDISGTVISQKAITQKLGTLYWMDLATDFPDTRNRMGTFEVTVVNPYTTTLTGVSLEWGGNGAFTIITPFEN
jgi:hypothetical protein